MKSEKNARIAALLGKKSFRIVGVCLIALILMGSGLLVVRAVLFNPLVVTVQGLNEREFRALEKLAAAFTASEPSARLRISRAGDATALESILRKADIAVFHPGGKSARAAGLCALPEESLAGLVSLSLRQPTQGKDGDYALPLALDHFGLSVDPAALRAAGAPEPSSVDALEAACAKLKATGRIPLALAGKDDETLLAMAGYLVAGPAGLGTYDALADALQKGASFDQALDRSLPGESPAGHSSLRQALEPLVKWIRAGYLPPGWSEMDAREIRSLAEGGNAAMLFVSRSQSAEFGSASMNFRDMRFPAFKSRTTASVIAPMLVAALPRAKGAKKSARAFLDFAISFDGQRALTQAGLAPVVAAFSPQDIRAGDVRQWAIMSERVLQGLPVDGFSSPSQEKEFAEKLRVYLVRESRK